MTPISAHALGPRYRIIASIDPGAITGMIAVAVDAVTLDLTQGRLVGEAVVKIGNLGDAEELQLKRRTLKLFEGVRRQLMAWKPTRVVIENPTDALATWGAGKRTMGARRGTIAALGAHLGICAAAAIAIDPDIELVAYHVTSRRDGKNRRGHIGWMQGNAPRPMAHEQVAREMGYLLRTLRERPHSGILPRRSTIFATPDDNVLMALGVLNFHLQRERGRLIHANTRGP